jgi:hypothetical protein
MDNKKRMNYACIQRNLGQYLKIYLHTHSHEKRWFPVVAPTLSILSNLKLHCMKKLSCTWFSGTVVFEKMYVIISSKTSAWSFICIKLDSLYLMMQVLGKKIWKQNPYILQIHLWSTIVVPLYPIPFTNQNLQHVLQRSAIFIFRFYESVILNSWFCTIPSNFCFHLRKFELPSLKGNLYQLWL